MSTSVAPASPTRGLLFDADELPRIRATLQRPEFAAFWKYALGADLAADERFLRTELNLKSVNSDLARAANILQRCAFIHVIAPDPRQVALARLALGRILEYPRWDWFLEAGKHTVGIMRNGTTSISVVLAADWLAEEFTAAEHAAIEKHISTEAGPAAECAIFGMNHHDKVVGWSMNDDCIGITKVDVSRWPAILDVNNLRIIATSGLAAAAALLAGRDPRAAHWAAMARDSLKLFVSRLPADGAFPEGPDYWHFTFNYFAVSADLLRRRCDIDVRDAADFPAMARYVLMVTQPTRDIPAGCLNLGDAYMTSGAEPLAWIGRHFRDSTANHLVLQPGTIRELPNSAWAAIWFDPSIPARRSPDMPLDRVIYPGIVISRTGWTANDSVLSLRSGEPENHEHADRNSLIFAAHGDRLLHDPLKANYSPRDPKWFLRLTAAHTAVLIDGRGHQYHNGEEGTNASKACAHLTDHRVGLDWMSAVSDATAAYALTGLPVRHVQRTVIFLKPDVLIVCDEVRLDTALGVQTRWQVVNEDGRGAVTTEGNTFTITRPQATLRAVTAANAGFTIRADRLPLPDSGGSYPFAAVTSAAATEHCLLTVCTAAPAGEAHGTIALESSGETWQITGTHRGRAVCVMIKPVANGAPVVTV